MVSRALAAAERLSGEGIDLEVIDLRSIRPIDTAAIIGSACKTGRVLIVHEACLTGGIGAEIAAILAGGESFDFLDAPIRRLGGRDIPIPYNPVLERSAVPQEDDILAAARRLVKEGR